MTQEQAFYFLKGYLSGLIGKQFSNQDFVTLQDALNDVYKQPVVRAYPTYPQPAPQIVPYTPKQLPLFPDYPSPPVVTCTVPVNYTENELLPEDEEDIILYPKSDI